MVLLSVSIIVISIVICTSFQMTTEVEEKPYPTEEFDPTLKHVLVFTMSGKPVWSRYGIEETNTAFVGILFTIYSILDESDDQIREIELGQGSHNMSTACI